MDSADTDIDGIQALAPAVFPHSSREGRSRANNYSHHVYLTQGLLRRLLALCLSLSLSISRARVRARSFSISVSYHIVLAYIFVCMCVCVCVCVFVPESIIRMCVRVCVSALLLSHKQVSSSTSNKGSFNQDQKDRVDPSVSKPGPMVSISEKSQWIPKSKR